MYQCCSKCSFFLQEKGSGWALQELLFLEINLAKYAPLQGSKYIKLPKEIGNKRAIINIQNDDSLCFVWSILAALYPVRNNPCSVSNYWKYFHTLNLTGIEFPISFSKIKLFESLNPDISINVFGLEMNNNKRHVVVGPFYHTQNRKSKHINLLLLEDDEGKNHHFCLIKCFSRLIARQISNKKSKKYICDGCLQFFSSENLLSKHMEIYCNKCVTILPSPEHKILKYKNYEKQIQVPFVVYADFESLLVPYQTCEPDLKKSFTTSTHIHKPYSFGYYIKCSYDDSLSEFRSYKGEDSAKMFCKLLTDDSIRIYNNFLKTSVPMKPLTSEEQLSFDLAKVCYLCDMELGCDKVRDHCHITGIYRGCCHSSCNLQVKVVNFIPVFLHNLSNYDCHLFIKELAEDGSKIDIIPINKEKYISFTKKILVDKIDNENVYINLRFLDSFRFMSSKLDKLAANLEDEQCNNTRKFFPDEIQFQLMRQKGIFPYSYLDSLTKLSNTELPSKLDFYDSLQDKHISDIEYERAKRVWNLFSCKNLSDYSDLYLKADVILLSDIFENFRKICMKTYNLDPASFFTLPALSWQAMLKFTKIELELLTDVDMIHFLQKNIRGGYSSVCSKRYSEANNPYIPSNYDKSKPTSYLMYWDANNLYGFALSQSLPVSGFRWMEQDEIDKFNLFDIELDGSQGYVLETDLIYPKSLHEDHNDMPFCPEKLKLSNSTSSKLIQSFFDKHHYVIYYKNLRQCLEKGVELVKIHKILTFKQSPWMKNFIEFNTQLRQQSKNEFDKDFYKLINNANYGKSIENVEKRVNVKLVNFWEKRGRKFGAEILISKPNFHSLSIFNDNFVAIQMRKSRIYYDKPIYVGFVVLELAKHVMYEFHYDYIKQKYGNHATLLYTDTDSLLYEIQTANVYQDVKESVRRFDTSNYNPSNQFQIPLQNKAIPSLMKDEAFGELIWHFVGLRSKMYAVNIAGRLTKKAKGIKKCVSETLTDEDFKSSLDENKIILKRQNVFRSLKHIIYTQAVNKIALSANDDKRFLIPGCYNTLAWGHYKIPFYEQESSTKG